MGRYELNKTKYLLDDERARLVETLERFHSTNLRDTTGSPISMSQFEKSAKRP